MKMYTIWSLRHSHARGNHWINERQCQEDTVQEWLKVFRNDEPKVIFIAKLGNRKPNLK